jgi:hypothetical protein
MQSGQVNRLLPSAIPSILARYRKDLSFCAVAETDVDACKNCDPQNFRTHSAKEIDFYDRPRWWQILDFVLKSCDEAVSS